VHEAALLGYVARVEDAHRLAVASQDHGEVQTTGVIPLLEAGVALAGDVVVAGDGARAARRDRVVRDGPAGERTGAGLGHDEKTIAADERVTLALAAREPGPRAFVAEGGDRLVTIDPSPLLLAAVVSAAGDDMKDPVFAAEETGAGIDARGLTEEAGASGARSQARSERESGHESRKRDDPVAQGAAASRRADEIEEQAPLLIVRGRSSEILAVLHCLPPMRIRERGAWGPVLLRAGLVGTVALAASGGCQSAAPAYLGPPGAGACRTDADCAKLDGPCRVGSCIENHCGATIALPGTLVSKDSPPDCKAVVCGPDGAATVVGDVTNVPPPNGPCVATRCDPSGAVTLTDVAFGVPCGGALAARCNGRGACVGSGPADVLTHHNDNARTGLQPAEVLLTPANVNLLHFGLAFTIPVDDPVYAQPLYVGSLDFGGAIHEVLYVVTMGDSAYAFDAASGQTLWHAPLHAADETPLVGPFTLPGQSVCATIVGDIGALATPAIDLAIGPNGTLFAVAEIVDAGGAPHFRLHALDLVTGAERPGSPVAIENLQVDGQGAGGDGDGHVLFDPTYVFSRLSLLVAGGNVFMGFSSICDQGPYHGWLLAYDEQTLALAGVFNATPDSTAGGIWEGGDGPAADSDGDIYVVTGNGPFDANSMGGRDYGDSMLRMSPALEVLDSFTPYDALTLGEEDLDLGSAGVLIVPGTNLLAHVSKTDTLRLVDRGNMGGYNAAGDSQIVAELALGPTPTPVESKQQHQGQSNPVAWNVDGGPMIYFQSWQDPLRQYQLKGTQLSLVAVNDSEAMPYYPGAGLSLSSDGASAGTGILWALMGWPLQQGTLMAFDATDISRTLWSSPASDDWLYLVHTKPTVANGRVYVPTGSKEIVVYASR
jgi:outer membrane protein assembly factor BamB